jgi:hypothetical protein
MGDLYKSQTSLLSNILLKQTIFFILLIYEYVAELFAYEHFVIVAFP